MSLDQALAGTHAATSRTDNGRDGQAYGGPAEADAETAQIDAVRVWAVDSVRVLPGAGTGPQTSPEIGTGHEADQDDTTTDTTTDAADTTNTADATETKDAPEADDRSRAVYIADSDTTANVRRPAGSFPRPPGAPERTSVSQVSVPPAASVPPDGPTVPGGFLRRRPYASAGGDGAVHQAPVREEVPRAREAGPVPEWPEPVGEAPPVRPVAPRRHDGPLAAAILRAGDVPIKVVYGIGAALATALIVILIFVLFSGDRPDDPVRVGPVRGGGGEPGATTPAKPTPTPIAVPPVPDARPMTVFDGPGSPIASYVQDQKAGLSYPQYAGPWAKTTRAPFSAAQRAGSSAKPQTLIVSAPLPGNLGKAPVVYSDFRALAGRAAKWTLRHQPADARFSWTVSQRTRYGVGWMLGYKLTYRLDGKKHTSQSYVMVVATGREKPAMLFATVPDTRAALYRDLNMLFWTARPI
jgi:hypothetical protein